MTRRDKAIKRKQQNQSAMWIVLAVTGIALLAAGLFFGFQKQTAREDSDGNPIVSVDQDLIEYGDQRFNEMISFEITVTNTGDGTLRFTEDPYIEVREGC